MRSVAIAPIQIKILTMATKKQLRNMVFLFNNNHPQSFYGAFFPSFILIAIGLWSRLTKIIGKFVDYNEFCTIKGTLRKNFGK